MRKVLITIALIAVAVWLAMWLGSAMMSRALSTGSEHAWPLGLGTLSDVPQRYRATTMSSSAARLIALARPLGIDVAPRDRSSGVPTSGGPMAFVRSQLDAWVMTELHKPVAAIDPMPSESGEYLAAHAGDLASVRTLLLTDDAIVWRSSIRDPTVPLPNLTGLMQLHRMLIASALDRTRVNDARAWDDLRAAWRLSTSLAPRPELISTLTAVAIARRVNAAASKLPLPPAPWMTELETFDFRSAFIAAYQVEAWSIADQLNAEMEVENLDGSFEGLVRRKMDVIAAPYRRISAADIAEQWRHTAFEFANTSACDFDPADLARRQAEAIAWWNVPARRIMTPNLHAMWQSVLRLNAERETTTRALRLRAGMSPQPQSRCSDGAWIYSADGRSFAFSRKMRTLPVPATALPLEFALDARQ